MTSLHTEHADEGQQHCCWESLRDYSFVKLKLQPSQTELLFRSVADCFLESEVHAEAHPMLCKHSESREQKKTNEFVFSADRAK